MFDNDVMAKNGIYQNFLCLWAANERSKSWHEVAFEE